MGFMMKIIPESVYDKYEFFRDPYQTKIEQDNLEIVAEAETMV